MAVTLNGKDFVLRVHSQMTSICDRWYLASVRMVCTGSSDATPFDYPRLPHFLRLSVLAHVR
eukprot:3021743-Pleurochrysis_carterae.AAC.1